MDTKYTPVERLRSHKVIRSPSSFLNLEVYPFFFKGETMKINTYFGYRHGELTTIVISTMDNERDALDCNYYIANPQDAEKQIDRWKKEHAT